MQISAIAAVQALRDEHRRLRHGGMVPRFWGMLRREWQRLADRVTARAS
jgi:hypothetical protein